MRAAHLIRGTSAGQRTWSSSRLHSSRSNSASCNSARLSRDSFAGVRLDRAFIVRLAQPEETPVGLDLGLADKLVIMAARRGGLRLRARLLGLLALRDRLDSGEIAAADRHQELVAVIAQQLLHALDGIALVVEHVADAFDQLDILRPVVAPATAAFQRLDLGEAGLPETQHMLRQIEIVSDFADRTERVWTLLHAE